MAAMAAVCRSRPPKMSVSILLQVFLFHDRRASGGLDSSAVRNISTENANWACRTGFLVHGGAVFWMCIPFDFFLGMSS